MDSPVIQKKNWVLTQEAFNLLLGRLDADPEQAGQKYERLRFKLFKYFRWLGVPFPDGEVDETFNRVARRLAEGEEVLNLNAYFYGVARMVFAESLRERDREQESLGSVREAREQPQPAEADSVAAERRDCLDRCLRLLPKESMELIIDYYQDEKGKKIERRRNLASRLGIPLNALRIRAHRIRVGLEACVRECMRQSS